ncbi:hypothetical protein GOV03_03790 [Candidatus Woesearchaeota archaeon]|nr:hypothetical protein [Candidatus Woesearchaeota archaeon]
MDLQEHMARQTMGLLYYSRALQTLREHPEMKADITEVAKETFFSSWDDCPPEENPYYFLKSDYERAIEQTDFGEVYVQDFLQGILREWGHSRKHFEAAYRKDIGQLESLEKEIQEAINNNRLDLLGTYKLDSFRQLNPLLVKKAIREKLSCLERRDNVIKTLVTQDNLATEKIRSALRLEYDSAKDYFADFSTSYDAKNFLSQAATMRIRNDSSLPVIVVDISDFLKDLFTATFIQADVDWLYQ